MPCQHQLKESRNSYVNSRQRRHQSRKVIRDKARHHITIERFNSQEDITFLNMKAPDKGESNYVDKN